MSERPIVSTRSHVVMTRASAIALHRQLHGYRQLAGELRARLRDANDLLLLSLHELAAERGIDAQRFSRAWLSEHHPQPHGGEAEA